MIIAIVSHCRRRARHVERADGGWAGSTINGYVEKGDEPTYKLNFRCGKVDFNYIVEMLNARGYLRHRRAPAAPQWRHRGF